MRRAWSFLWLVIVSFILITIAVEAIKPFLPLIGIALSLMILGAIVLGVLRLLYHRRRFF